MISYTTRILTLMPSLALAYIAHRSDKSDSDSNSVSPVVAAWSKILATIAVDESLALQCFPILLDGVERGDIPSCMRLEDENVLDEMIGKLVSSAVSSGEKEGGAREVIKGLLKTPCEIVVCFNILRNLPLSSQSPSSLDVPSLEYFTV